MGTKDTKIDVATLLHFYAEAGIDDLVEPEPVDRFALPPREPEPAREESRQPAPARAPKPPAPPARRNTDAPQPASGATIPDQAAVDDARQAARSAGSVPELRQILERFEGCNLRAGARTTVFADGNTEAAVMFVGEAPGREEDLQGLPFVGRAGQLLDRMLAAIQLDRDTAYITNIIPWRPPGNRTPTPLEIELCRPFIERHIELVNPKLLVFMGNVSTKSLLHTQRGILSFRGTWSRYKTGDSTEIPALPTLHPAYLLRNPAHKRLSWIDFLGIRRYLDNLGL